MVNIARSTSLQDVSNGLEQLLHCAAQQRRLSLARFALRLGAEVHLGARWNGRQVPPIKWWLTTKNGGLMVI